MYKRNISLVPHGLCYTHGMLVTTGVKIYSNYFIVNEEDEMLYQ